jgi:hypothetical protein
MAPLPLVPYAVGLSLTVAYRGLRDNHLDAERAQADLATRCETLEKLSTYWWTADAMARLGRKALKSLQQPGVQKVAVASIAGEMEAEVTVCKFGPFEPKASSAATPSTTKTSEVNGNALRLLSDAAATHSNTGPKNALQVTPASMTLSMPGTRGGETPATMNTATATTATLPPTPSNLFGTSEAGPMDVGGVYDHFNDLDNLFDGFFDLSMPTIFQDPLFDGEAFVNANMDFSTGGLMDDVDGGAGAFAGSHGPSLGGSMMGHPGGHTATGGGGPLYPDLGLNGRGY